MKNRFTSLLFVLIFVSSLKAQELDLFNTNLTLSPIKTDDGSFDLYKYDLALTFPLFHNDKRLVLLSTQYEYYYIDNIFSLGTDHLHGIGIQLAYLMKINKKHGLSFIFAPKLNSDFADISSKDFRFNLGAIMKAHPRKNLELGIGLGYSRQFFGHVLMPVMRINWEISDKFSLSGPIPLKPQLTYFISEKLRTGVFLHTQNSSSRLSENRLDNQFIKYSYWDANLFLKYKIRKNLFAHITVGHVLKRQLQLYSDTDDLSWNIFTFQIGKKTTTPVDSYSNSGSLFQIGISYSVSGTNHGD